MPPQRNLRLSFSAMNYSQKLKDPRWQKKRLEIMDRDNYCCQLCSDDKTELQVHHKVYSGEPWEANNEDLITLCCHCHNIETDLNKEGDSISVTFKKNNEYYFKTKNKTLIIAKTDDGILYKALHVKNIPEFKEIIGSLFK